MRAFAGLFCLTVSFVAAPAMAQTAGGAGVPAASGPVSSAQASKPAVGAPAGGLSFGGLDKLTIKKGAERPVLSLGPIETDQLGLSWRAGGKWGLTLDLTSRADNDVLPREELAAGAYYQVTPRFRFGGGVTLNGTTLSDAAEGWTHKDGEAGVRIESAFSF
ncbi:MAG: hypothetical protein SGJ21_16415 [Alphaproteobacteria bacterium]|nr:hypothetical protein [Alphaproteobacteria bacterium]